VDQLGKTQLAPGGNVPQGQKSLKLNAEGIPPPKKKNEKDAEDFRGLREGHGEVGDKGHCSMTSGKR